MIFHYGVLANGDAGGEHETAWFARRHPSNVPRVVGEEGDSPRYRAAGRRKVGGRRSMLQRPPGSLLFMYSGKVGLVSSS